jgi:hypothetical protein
MKNNRLSTLFGMAVLILLTACGSNGHALSAELLRPSDTINGLVLATGAENALPLWSVCSPSPENTHIRTFNCRASATQTLAIGHVFLLAEEVSADSNGSDLVWGLSIDGQVVDLDSFGKFEYVMPSMAKRPSPVREVFKKAVGWNIVLTNLSPGEHTLAFRAHSEAVNYMWLVDLVVEGTDGADVSAAPFPLHS